MLFLLDTSRKVSFCDVNTESVLLINKESSTNVWKLDVNLNISINVQN